jgi:hypothetical protein
MICEYTYSNQNFLYFLTILSFLLITAGLPEIESYVIKDLNFICITLLGVVFFGEKIFSGFR